MAKGKKKSGRKPTTIEKIAFATAVLNLIKIIVDIIKDIFK